MVKLRFADSTNVPITDLPAWQRLVAGACAGLCYWVGTYPLDVIKGRMQAAPFPEKQNWWAIAQSIRKEYG